MSRHASKRACGGPYGVLENVAHCVTHCVSLCFDRSNPTTTRFVLAACFTYETLFWLHAVLSPLLSSCALSLSHILELEVVREKLLNNKKSFDYICSGMVVTDISIINARINKTSEKFTYEASERSKRVVRTKTRSEATSILAFIASLLAIRSARRYRCCN